MQHGTYQVTLRADVIGFSSVAVYTTFTITVLDPCLTTTLIPPTISL